MSSTLQIISEMSLPNQSLALTTKPKQQREKKNIQENHKVALLKCTHTHRKNYKKTDRIWYSCLL